MIPYFTLADKTIYLGPVPIQWFGILVATGVILGVNLTRRRAKKLGYDADKLESFIWWMLACGFVVSHMFDVIVYYPETLVTEPWKLLFIWQSLSSFGGFLGAIIGNLLWKRFKGRGQPILAFSDLILSVFPIAWTFGRIGCTVVHDHPGIAATGPLAFLAIDYPAGNIHNIPAGPHWNLGFLEMLYSIVISAVVVSLWRKPRPVGTYAAVTCLMYAPIRFLLDFLRTADAVYLGLTPGQYASIAMFLFGAWMAVQARARRFDATVAAVKAEPEPTKPATPSRRPRPSRG
ncbi:MAG TPA: prolipoprotein diacylglyceryl transferase family protein [Haliangiales bacterium]|nr:prolipoprotein diacylglyceryl transferase family protein [Haliangiales bacterium]